MTIKEIEDKFENAFAEAVFPAGCEFESNIKSILGDIISHLKEKESAEKSKSFKKETYGKTGAKWEKYGYSDKGEL